MSWLRTRENVEKGIRWQKMAEKAFQDWFTKKDTKKFTEEKKMVMNKINVTSSNMRRHNE